MKICTGDQGLTLALLFLVSLLGEVDFQMIPPLLPLLATTLQVQPGYVGRAVPIYSISAGIFSLLFGCLSDQFGRKPFIKYGLLGFSGASLFTCLAGSIELLFIARFLSGMTAGGLTTCATSYAADMFYYEKRGQAMGVLSGAYFTAAILGVPLATTVAATRGWRPIFLVISGLAVCAALLVSKFLAANPHSGSQSPLSRDRLNLARIKRVTVASLKKKETAAILWASLLSSGAIVGFITYLGSHLNGQLHVPVQRIGLLFLWAGVTSLIGAPLAGVLSDKWGKKTVLVVSGIALAACLFAVPRLSWSLWLFSSLGLAGLAIAFRMAPLLAIITELVPIRERGTLLAVRDTLSQLGIAVSTLVSSYCYLYWGYQAVGLFSASLIVTSTLLVLFLVVEPNQPSETERSFLQSGC